MPLQKRFLRQKQSGLCNGGSLERERKKAILARCRVPVRLSGSGKEMKEFSKTSSNFSFTDSSDVPFFRLSLGVSDETVSSSDGGRGVA
jgi:hypothetical protein